MLKSNGLTLHTIKSELKEIEKIDTIEQEAVKWMKTNASFFVVAYLDHTVLIGQYNDKGFNFHNNALYDDRYVQKIRIFDKDKELLIWRSGNGFKGRYREDRDGDEVDVVDVKQVLFGTDKEDLKNGFTRISEKRGTEIILPFTGLEVNDKDKRVFIQTRNYIGYNEAHQATYIDCRFMGFMNNEKPLI